LLLSTSKILPFSRFWIFSKRWNWKTRRANPKIKIFANQCFQLLYCACQKIAEKWNQPLQNWALTISQLEVYFEERQQLKLTN